jgi:putative addiction module antidote
MIPIDQRGEGATLIVYYNEHGYPRFGMKLKLRSVGTSTGLVLPKEMLVRLRAKKDDTLFAIETPAGYLLTPYDPEVEKQLDLGREFTSKYRSVFHALSK